jgi:hypothetical protein
MYSLCIIYYVVYYMVFLRLCYMIYADRNQEQEWIYIE